MPKQINVKLTPPFVVLPIIQTGKLEQVEWEDDDGAIYLIQTIGDVIIVTPKPTAPAPDNPLVLPTEPSHAA